MYFLSPCFTIINIQTLKNEILIIKQNYWNTKTKSSQLNSFNAAVLCHGSLELIEEVKTQNRELTWWLIFRVIACVDNLIMIRIAPGSLWVLCYSGQTYCYVVVWGIRVYLDVFREFDCILLRQKWGQTWERTRRMTPASSAGRTGRFLMTGLLWSMTGLRDPWVCFLSLSAWRPCLVAANLWKMGSGEWLDGAKWPHQRRHHSDWLL